MVKTAYTDAHKQILGREHHNHKLPPIATSPYIRSLYDTVYTDESAAEPSSLVFEWMDYDASQISEDEYRRRPILTKRVSKAVLEALVTIKNINAMHTGQLFEHLSVPSFPDTQQTSSPTISSSLT